MTFNCAGICLVSKSLVLLCRRIEFFNGKSVELGGYWSPFAGSIEEGESPKECAIRELKEESGVVIDSDKVVFQKIIKRKKGRVHFHFFIAELDSFPEIELDYEHTEFGVFKIDCLETLNPVDSKVIKSLKLYYENATRHEDKI
jgi:8-oxo-dGTP pyrophosphatase MutT (NUDIX family)